MRTLVHEKLWLNVADAEERKLADQSIGEEHLNHEIVFDLLGLFLLPRHETPFEELLEVRLVLA